MVFTKKRVKTSEKWLDLFSLDGLTENLIIVLPNHKSLTIQAKGVLAKMYWDKIYSHRYLPLKRPDYFLYFSV